MWLISNSTRYSLKRSSNPPELSLSKTLPWNLNAYCLNICYLFVLISSYTGKFIKLVVWTMFLIQQSSSASGIMCIAKDILKSSSTEDPESLPPAPIPFYIDDTLYKLSESVSFLFCLCKTTEIYSTFNF